MADCPPWRDRTAGQAPHCRDSLRRFFVCIDSDSVQIFDHFLMGTLVIIFLCEQATYHYIFKLGLHFVEGPQ